MILILGRFQPMHRGHLKVIEDAHREDRDLVIAIGSSQKKNESVNPFSGAERKQMLKRVLDSKGIKAKIVLVPDIECDCSYIRHVEKHIKGRPGLVITENRWTIRLFRSAGYKVRVTPRHFRISSTDIRQRIAENKKWEYLVPRETAELIKKIKGVQRIRKIFSSASSGS